MENAATAADANIDTTVSEGSLIFTVIDDTTVPSACTVVTAPSTGDIVRPDGDTFSFTMQSKSSDGLDQAVTNDRYIVTLTSLTAEEKVKKDAGQSYNEVIVTNTASPVSGSDGRYTADLQVTQAGTYDVLITMENASTDANSEISTIVSDDLTLVITDITTVPDNCLVNGTPTSD